MSSKRGCGWTLCALLAWAVVTGATQGADTYWISEEGGDWLVAENWTDGLPSLNEGRNGWIGGVALSAPVTVSGAASALGAYIGDAYDAEVSIGTDGALTVWDLMLGVSQGAEGTLRLSGGKEDLEGEPVDAAAGRARGPHARGRA